MPRKLLFKTIRVPARATSARKRRVSHLRRATVPRGSAVHVTLRVRPDVPSLRGSRRFRNMWSAFCKARDRFGQRVIHFSVQRNHLHLVIEADDRRALSRGMQGLAIRLAKAINRGTGRRGKVFEDRYHANVVSTARAARNVLRYVLNNWRHHQRGVLPKRARDAFSSSAFFDGWAEDYVNVQRPYDWLRDAERGPPPVAPPTTDLLRARWRRLGPISVEEAPGPRPPG